MTTDAPTYEQDYLGWLRAQEAHLKHRNLEQLDAVNLILEIDHAIMRLFKKRRMYFEDLLTSLLCWRYRLSFRSDNCKLIIIGQRRKIFNLLFRSPSLKEKLPHIVHDYYYGALLRAVKETKLDQSIFPEICPWFVNQIMDDKFYPNPEGM